MSDSLRPHGLQPAKPARLLCPWDFPGKNIGVGCRFLLQAIFPTQGLNLGFLHCRQTLYHLSYFTILLIYFWPFWVLLLCGLFSSCSLWASHCGRFSCGAQALGWMGFSGCGSQVLEHSVRGCGARAQLLHGTWGLPGPGVRPVSSALAGGAFTAEPLGKPHTWNQWTDNNNRTLKAGKKEQAGRKP